MWSVWKAAKCGALAAGATIASGMAHAQWNQWKAPIPQPSCNASGCFNWSSTPMRSAPGGSHPALQGPASMEGWWQADCARYSYLPGGQGGGRGPYLAVYQYNPGWIWVACYLPNFSPANPTANPPCCGPPYRVTR